MGDESKGRPRRRVLLLTNSEYGQANVMLAVIHELLLSPDVDIHLASFAPLAPRADELSAWHQSMARAASAPRTSTLAFHTIPGLAMIEAIKRAHGENFMAHRPTFFGALAALKLVPEWLAAWDGPEYMAIFEACLQLIHDLQADVIVCDPLFSQAIDALKVLELQWVVLTPTSMREILPQIQPPLEMIFRYPAMCTNYPYPLPWSYVLPNLILQIQLIINILNNTRLKAISKYRNEHGAPGVLPAYEPYSPKTHYLSSTMRPLDYPYSVVPDNFQCCGPINIAGPPVAECDPDLAKWLAQAPTVMINLGTIVHFLTETADHMSRAIKTLLDRNSKVQVLWKIKLDAATTDVVHSHLGADIAAGRLRIASWLTPQPPIILETGHVICSVHHGGANSFWDAVGCGVPAIILPSWLDCYAFATIADHTGVGIVANRDVAPQVDAHALTTALQKIVGFDDAPPDPSFRDTAAMYGRLAKKLGGRRAAADKILELAALGGKW